MPSIHDLEKPLRQVWRTYITPPPGFGYCEDEITLFVEASDRNQARENVRRVVTMLYPLMAEDRLENCYYNLFSAQKMIDEGSSENLSFRLFECGWRGNTVASWDNAPVFAVRDPGALFKAWHAAKTYFETKTFRITNYDVADMGQRVALAWDADHIRHHKALATRIVKSIEKFVRQIPFQDELQEMEDIRCAPNLFEHLGAIFTNASKQVRKAEKFREDVKAKTEIVLTQKIDSLAIEECIALTTRYPGGRTHSDLAMKHWIDFVKAHGRNEKNIRLEVVRLLTADYRLFAPRLRDKMSRGVSEGDVEMLIQWRFSENAEPLPTAFLDWLRSVGIVSSVPAKAMLH